MIPIRLSSERVCGGYEMEWVLQAFPWVGSGGGAARRCGNSALELRQRQFAALGARSEPPAALRRRSGSLAPSPAVIEQDPFGPLGYEPTNSGPFCDRSRLVSHWRWGPEVPRQPATP
jgi:hypothetical protein